MSLSTPSPSCRVDKIILSAIINTFRIENMATVYGTLGPCFFFSFFWVASVLAQQTSYLIIGSNVDYRIFCRHKRSCRRDQNFFAAKITCPFFRIWLDCASKLIDKHKRYTYIVCQLLSTFMAISWLKCVTSLMYNPIVTIWQLLN